MTAGIAVMRFERASAGPACTHTERRAPSRLDAGPPLCALATPGSRPSRIGEASVRRSTLVLREACDLSHFRSKRGWGITMPDPDSISAPVLNLTGLRL